MSTKIIFFEKIDDKVINEIRNRIVKVANPDRIILFGSYAYGKPNSESDLDILVIMNSTLPKYKRAIPIYECLTGLMIPKDIVVYTPEEIEEWNNVPQAFVTSVVKKGKVIYEKK